MTVPTAANPARHIDTNAGHGWVYWDETVGRWLVEHCVDGRWGACPIGGAHDELWVAQKRATGHLARARKAGTHRMPCPQRLAGPDRQHAGGGTLPYRKGPPR